MSAHGDHVEIVVVGAGFAGIAAALELSEAGHEVVVVERGDRVGGTWRENVYPGVACDVPAHLYSLSRHPNPAWSHRYAPGGEIARYLDDVVDRTGLRRDVRLGSALTAADWDEDAGLWRLAFTGAGPGTADVLILAAGRLTAPRIPEIDGLGGFAGDVVHTARWDPTMPVSGRRIAVVGTGSSSVQLVPELARRGAEVTVFQRTPAWILPRGGRAYTEAERRAFVADPALILREREQAAAADDERFAARSGRGASAAEAARAEALAHLRAQVPDRMLRRALTPAYPFGCKRVVLSDDFYPVLGDRTARLEPSALVSVRGGDLVAASGTRVHDVDLLVLATGFEAARQPYADLVRGEGGQTLATHWAGGMTAAATTVVTGFPNLFVLGGPNAALAHTSSLFVLEQQAAFVRRALARRPEHDGVLRALPSAERAATAAIDAASENTPWLAGCRSWYVDDRARRLTLLWPGTVAEFERMIQGAENQVFTPVLSGTRGAK